MARRRTSLEPIGEDGTPQPSRAGGESWEICFKAFMESLTLRNLSWYTKKHHKENLKHLPKILGAVPIRVTTDALKK